MHAHVMSWMDQMCQIDKAGSGIFIEYLKQAILIKVSSTNILSVEMAAILTALNLLSKQRPRPLEKVIIFTDSRTAL